MGRCKCPKVKITSTDWKERFEAAKCVCKSDARLHAEENGRKIEVRGDNYANIDKVKVDGALIDVSTISKCDYFFGHKVKGKGVRYANNVFVELKGCDIGKAYDQIMETISVFKRNKVLCHDSVVNGVIVGSHIPKAGGKTLTIKSLFKQYTRGTLHIKENILTYDIVKNIIAN
jgi:hypothetical protein